MLILLDFVFFVNFLLLNSRFIETILATLETTDSTGLVHIFFLTIPFAKVSRIFDYFYTIIVYKYDFKDHDKPADSF